VLGQPVVELVDDGPALLLAYAQPFIDIYVLPLALEFIKLPDEQQRLLGNLALAGRKQFEELAPRMSTKSRNSRLDILDFSQISPYLSAVQEVQ
jgi:hypothetical protein